MLNTSLNYKNGLSWLKNAYLLFKKNPGTSIVVSASFLIIIIATSILSSFIPIVGGVIFQTLFMCLSAGFLFYIHNLAHSSKENKLNHINNFFFAFKDIRLIGKMVLATIFYFSIILLALLLGMIVDYFIFIKDFTDLTETYIKNNNTLTYIEPTLVIKLLIIPTLSLVLASLAGIFAPYLIIFKNTSFFKAFYLSLKASISNFGAFFCYTMIVFLLLIISGMTIGVGLIVTIPIVFMSSYYMFCDLFYGLEAQDKQ